MGDSQLVKPMYSGEPAGNRPAGRLKKKWIESVKEYLKEKSVSLAMTKRKPSLTAPFIPFSENSSQSKNSP